MTLAWVSQGTVGVGSTSVTPGLPASLATGDGVLIMVVTKPDTATINTPANWTLIANVAGGGGTVGNGVGPTRQAWFFREKDASWSTMPAISITSGNSSAAIASRYTKVSTNVWSIVSTTGAYGTSATTTNGAATLDAASDIATDDLLVVGYSNMDEAPTWSAQSVTATGATIGAATERSEAVETTTGNDIGGMYFTAPVTAGTSSAAPATSATLSVAGRGTVALIRLREVVLTSKSGSESTAISVAETTDIVPVTSPTIFTDLSNVENTRNLSWTIPELAVNDVIVIEANTWGSSETLALPSGGGLEFTERVNLAPGGGFSRTYIWTAVATGAGTNVVVSSVYSGAVSEHSGILYQYPGTAYSLAATPNIVSASGASGTVASASLTGTSGNVASVTVTDWGTTTNQETWLGSGINDGRMRDDTSQYYGRINLTGSSTTVGLSAPSSAGGWTLAAVEVLTQGTVITDKAGSESTAVTVSETAEVLSSLSRTDTASISVNEGMDLDKGINNRASNPSFETELGTTTGANSTITRIQDATAWDGEYVASALIAASGGSGTSALTEATPVLPNTQYTVAMRYRLRSGTPSGTQRMQVRQYNTAGTQVISGNFTMTEGAPDSTWRTVSGTLTTEADATTLRLGYVSTIGAVSEIDMDGIQVNLGPTLLEYDPASTNTVSKSASDSAAISVDETSDSQRTFVVTDTASIAVSETISIDSTLVVTDTASLGISESSDILSTHYISADDGAGIGVTETSIASVAQSATDSVSIAVSESTAFDRALAADDTAALTATEMAGNYVTASGSDSISLGVVDDSEVFKDVSASDTAAVAVTESSAMFKEIIATDDAALSVTEVTVYSATLPGQENVAVGVAETTSILATTSVDDNAALSVNEISEVTVYLNSTDSSAISLIDEGSQFISKSATDGAVIFVTEIAIDEVLATEFASDSLVVTLEESAQTNVFISTSDSASLSIDESTSRFVTRVANDTLAVGLVDTAAIAGSQASTDGAAFIVTETATVLVIVSASDNADITVTDSSEESIGVYGSDSVAISVNETVAQAGNQPGADALRLGLTEETEIFVTVEVNDNISIVSTESASIVVPIETVDTGSVSVVESSNVLPRDSDAVLTLVYLTGQWVNGTMMVYRRGRWYETQPYAFHDGEWFSTEG